MLRARADAGRPFRRGLLCALALLLCAPAARANPVGPQVANGQVSVAQQGTTLNVTNSPGAIINWQGFSIAAGETTRFIQQSAVSSVLNRVVGPDPSVLLGTLTSNGRVFLINPSGILVGAGARIDVAGLVASTLNLNNQDFLAGRLNFEANAAAGAVENRGTITTPTGGSVYLVGSGVTNSGIVTSPQGDVILAAGQSVKILDTSTPGVRVEITASENAAVNLGSIVAKSGQIGIYAATLRNAGVINADQVVRGENGRIFLKANKDVTLEAGSAISASGDSGGSITVQAEQGTLLASGSVAATGTDGKGGDVKLLGHLVGLTDHATVDASGSAGGGSVLVGGDRQGANPDVQNAWRTYMGPDTSIRADATASGDGGKVIVWSDDLTRFYGAISAKGGVLGGNGGFVETSSHNFLVALGSVNTLAPYGMPGRWLLDPTDINIVAAGTATPDTLLTGQLFQDVTALATSEVTIAALTGALATGDVTISTNNALGTGTGNINWLSGANLNYNGLGTRTLTLNANNNITLAGNITDSVAGGDVLNLALNAGGTATISGSTVALSGGTLSAGAGGITVGTGTQSTFSALTLNSDLSIPSSGTLVVNNGLTLANGHKVTLAGGAGNAILSFQGAAQTLGGTGEVVFGGTTVNNLLDSNLTSGQVLTVGPGIKIHSGAGGQGAQIRLFSGMDNQGVISSDGGRAITINQGGTLTNSGTLSADGVGSVLTIAPTNWNGTGVVTALNTGTLNLGGTFPTSALAQLNGTAGTVNLTGTLTNTGTTLTLTPTTGNLQFGSSGRILNGTVSSAGGQLLLPTGVTNATLDGVTLDLDLTVASGASLVANNGLTLANGHKVTLAGGAGNAILSFQGAAQTLGGTGEVVFGGTTVNNLLDSNLTSGQVLTVGPGIKIHSGAGGQGAQIRLFSGMDNQGVISSDGGRAITINQGGTLTNSGTLSADGVGSVLTIAPTNWNGTGVVTALNTGTLNLGGTFPTSALAQLNGTAGTVNLTGTLTNTGTTLTLTPTTGNLQFGSSGRILNGTVSSAGGQLLLPTGVTNATLDGVTLDLDLTVASGASLVANNGLTLANGHKVTLAGGAGNAILSFQGAAQTLGGTGEVVFGGTTVNNLLDSNLTSGQVLTVGPGIKIHSGAGGQGAQIRLFSGMDNQGVISSDGGRAITINQGGTLTNSGTLSADGVGSVLTIAPTNWNGTGVVTALNTGTLNLGGTFPVSALGQFNASAGTVNITGTVNNAGNTLNIGSAGLFGPGGLNSLSGTIIGGTLINSDASRTLPSANGALDGVTLGSDLNLTGTLFIRNGLTLGNGFTFNINNNTVAFQTTGLQHIATLGTSTISMAGGTIQAGNGVGGQTLTIDTGVTVRGSGTINQSSAATIVNAGTILANTAGTLTISPSTFTNSGAITLSAGTLTIQPTTFTNGAGATLTQTAGTLNISTGTSTWSNAGTLNIQGGTVNLDGAFTLANLGTFNRTPGTVVNLTGALDLGGGTLDIGSGGRFGPGGLSTLNFGTIKNGTVTDNDTSPTLSSSNGAFDAVTLGSNLALSGSLGIRNNLLLGDGVTLNIGNGSLLFQTTGQQHLGLAAGATSATVSSSGGTIQAGNGVGGQTLTIDTGVTVRGSGTINQSSAATIVNAGTILANTAGTLTISPSTFTNSGAITLSAGTLTIQPTTFTNGTGATLTQTAGTLNISTGTSTWSNAGTLNIQGGTVNLDGAFTLANLGTFNRTPGTVVNLTGALDLGGGTLDIGSGGRFGPGGLSTLNFGTIKNGTVTDNDASPTLSSSNGAFDAVTLGSNLALSGSLGIRNNLLLGDGVTLNIGNGSLLFQTTGQQHLGLAAGATAATVSSSGGTIQAGNGVGGQTLTIDTGVTVRGSGTINQSSAATIVNAGTILANTAGTLTISPSTFTNSGAITLSAGTLTIQPTTFTNGAGATLTQTAGTLNISTGTSTWSNAGTLNIQGGTVNLDGAFTLANLGTFNRTPGTVVNLTGALDLGGGTLDIGSGGRFGPGGLSTLNFGTIKNGTVTDNDASPTLSSSNGAFDAVTLGSNLALSGSLGIRNNLLLGDGVTLNIGNGSLLFQTTGQQHLGLAAGATAATVSSSGGTIQAGNGVGGQTLTIDTGVTVRGSGTINQSSAATIVNAGSIISSAGAQTFAITANSFTNNGTLSIAGSINVGAGGTFTNNGTLGPGVVGGDTTSTLTITGNLVMGPTSIVNLDLNGPAAGDFDRITVSGTASLSGTLNLAGVGGAGSYAVVSATGGLLGTQFTSINLGTFTTSAQTYSATGLTLAVSANGNVADAWVGGTGTDWATASNWSAGVPTSGSNVFIGSGAGTVVVSTAGQIANTLTCDANFTISTGGALTLAGASTFNGTTNISGGTLTGAGPIAMNVANISGGTLTGSGAITITGTLTWSAGTIAGTVASTLTTPFGSTSNVTGGTLGPNRTWNNSGTLNVTPAAWTNSGTLNHNAGVLNLNGAFTTANMFAFNRAGGTTVNLNGTLTNSGTLDIGGTGIFGTGGLSALNGGTIIGGTLVSTDGTALTSNSGILDGVTIGTTGGNFTFDQGSFTYIRNNLTLASGVTVNLGNSSWGFNTTGTQNLTTAAGTAIINIAGGAIYAGYGVNGQVLQLGNGITLQGYGSLIQSSAADIVNNGSIVGNTAGQSFNLSATTFTNNGTLSVTAGTMNLTGTAFTNSAGASVTAGTGSTLSITPTTTFTNNGTLTLGGTTHTIGTTNTNWTNAGSLALNSGTLNLNGAYTTAGLTSNLGATHYTRAAGTAFNFTGTLSNSGTLDIGGTGIFGTGGLSALNGGTIIGGTLVSTDGTALTSNSGILDGVTIGTTGGNFTFDQGSFTYIRNNLTLASGVTVNLGNSSWGFNTTGTQNLTTAAGTAIINIAGGAIYAGYGVNGQVLQLGNGITLQGYGSLIQSSAADIVNNGSIVGNTAGQSFNLSATTFTNNGTLSVTAGTMNLTGTAFTNSAGASVTAGTGSTLSITPTTTFTNNGTLTLGGTTHTIGTTNTNWTNAGSLALNSGTLNLNGAYTTAGLTSNLGATHYTRAAGTAFNFTGTLSNSGTLDIGGTGIFGTGGLSALNGGTIIGGTLVSTDGTALTSNSGILDGVTIGTTGGNFTFDQGSFTYIRNNLTLASGVTVNLGNSSWGFNTTGTQNLTTAAGTAIINIAGGAIYAGYGVNGQVLQLGNGITLQGYGSLIQSSAADIVNNGSIVGNTAGQSFNLSAATFTNNGTLAVTAGTMNVSSAAFNQPGAINVAAGSTFTRAAGFINAGSIAGSGTLNLGTGTLTNNGSLTPGGTGATGTLDITGNLVNGASGTINVEIGGTAPGIQYDVIAVSGSATVGGTLNGSLINGFVPSGQNFDIITGASVSGSFGTSNLPSGFNGAVVGGFYRLNQSGVFCIGICWNGGAGTANWGDAANWTGGVLPGAGDIVQLNLVSGVTVSHASGNDVIRGLNSTANNNLVISGGSLTLNDPATTSNLAGGLTLSGTGTLTSNGTLNAAALNMSGGTLNGAGSLAVTNSFSQAGGIINIAGGVTITQANGALSLGQITAGAISATAQAGSLSATAPLVAQSGAITLVGTSGTMTLGGTIQASGAVTITNAGSIDFSGTLSFGGTGVINVGGGGTFTNNGVLRPGGAGTVRTLAINGNYSQGAGGTLDMDVSGPSTYDRLVVSGTAALGGTLLVTPVGYTPVNGDQYALLSYSGLPTGTFATITAPGFTGAAPSYATSGSFFFSMPAAAINTWLLDGSGSWLIPGNWSQGHAPVAGEVVIIPDYTTQFTVAIPSGTQTVGSVTVQGNDILAVNGGSLTFSLPSTINGTLAVAGGTVSANASLGVNTLNLSSGAYNGSGNLTVTNAFSHTGGIFNTTGAVSITQAAGNLALSQSLSAGSLLVNVAAGNLAVSGGVTLQTAGATTLNAANISIQDATFDASALTLAGAGNVTFAAGNVVLNTPVTTSMPVTVGGATVSFNGATSMRDLTLTAGALGGTGDLAISNSFTQTGGAVGSSFNSLSITQASGDLTVGSMGAVSTLVLDALNGSVSATGTLSAGTTVLISGNGVNVASVAGGAVIIDANAGVLNVNGPITSSGNNPIALTAADVNIPAGGSVNAGTGVVTIASTANGAVILGSGTAVANTLTLSNAELARIGAGVLGIDGGAISNDTAVAISGIGTVSLIGASAQLGNSFAVSGDLLAQLSGGFTLTAGSTPVLVQAGNVTIAANNVSINAGSVSGASAALLASTGDVNINSSGGVALVSGALVDSDALVLAARNIRITSFSCSGCSILPSLPSPAVLLSDSLTDTGVAVGPGGTVTIVTLSSVPQTGVLQQTTTISAVTTSVKAAETVAAPAALAIQPAATTVAGAASGGTPALTDPNGTVGGEAGTFGSSESTSGSGAGGGQQPAQGGKRAPAKKANARC